MNHRGTVVTGKWIYAICDDGRRRFVGRITSTRGMPNGILVGLIMWDAKMGQTTFKDFYLTDCSYWTSYDTVEELLVYLC